MYVRFHKKRLSDREAAKAGRTSVRAVLVGSARIDGKPRQAVIAYLTSWIEGHAHTPQELFSKWRSIDYELDRIDLSPEQRTRIEDVLEHHIPRTGYGEALAYRAQRLSEIRGSPFDTTLEYLRQQDAKRGYPG